MHYPLCYGEVGAYSSAMGCLAASFLSLRESLVQGSCGARGRIAGTLVAAEISNPPCCVVAGNKPLLFSSESCLFSCLT